MYEYNVTRNFIQRHLLLYSRNLQEWHDMELMQDENNRIREEVEALRGKYDALKRFAIMKNIPLPPELEIQP